MIEQYHLTGKRNSKRAVRVKGLDDVAVAENLSAAAKVVGANAMYMELKKQELRSGLTQFIVQVSEPCDDPFAPGVKWKKVTAMDFAEHGLGTFFNAKDVVILEALYREYHDVTTEELDAITGKAKAVSED